MCVGGGAPQDRPGPQNKVTFSAQQHDCLIILGSRAFVDAASLPPVFIRADYTWTR